MVSRLSVSLGGGHRRHKQNAFSLIELLFSLVIAAGLLAMSSSFRGFIVQNSMIHIVNELAANLHLARSEAILRNRRITLCQSENGKTCGRSNQWEKGWISFTDSNDNKKRDDTEAIIRVQPPLKPGYSLRWRGSSGTNHHLSYLASGRANKVGTYTLCHHHWPQKARTVLLIRSGRFRTSDRKSNGKRPDCP